MDWIQGRREVTTHNILNLRLWINVFRIWGLVFRVDILGNVCLLNLQYNPWVFKGAQAGKLGCKVVTFHIVTFQVVTFQVVTFPTVLCFWDCVCLSLVKHTTLQPPPAGGPHKLWGDSLNDDSSSSNRSINLYQLVIHCSTPHGSGDHRNNTKIGWCIQIKTL